MDRTVRLPATTLRIVRAVLFALAVILSPETGRAQQTCIANYSTDGTVERSPREDDLLGDLPRELRDIVEVRIEDALNGRAWRAPFAQARYDDLIFTLGFLREELGPEFTSQMKAAVVEQFISPVHLHETMDFLRAMFESDPERFRPLLERHAGAFAYWEQFGVCAYNSPYAFYRHAMERAFYDGSAGGARRAFHERLAAIPMRTLGGRAPIVRRAYLPDRANPRIRYALPPCEAENEARNVEFQYEPEKDAWIEVEPSLPIRTWYQRGFSDWEEIDTNFDMRGFRPTNPRQYAKLQSDLAARFEGMQDLMGLPVAMPDNVAAGCE